jgi:hypothetical protein
VVGSVATAATGSATTTQGAPPGGCTGLPSLLRHRGVDEVVPVDVGSSRATKRPPCSVTASRRPVGDRHAGVVMASPPTAAAISGRVRDHRQVSSSRGRHGRRRSAGAVDLWPVSCPLPAMTVSPAWASDGERMASRQSPRRCTSAARPRARTCPRASPRGWPPGPRCGVVVGHDRVGSRAAISPSPGRLPWHAVTAGAGRRRASRSAAWRAGAR